MARYVAAIDSGTTSTRCLLVDERGSVVASAQREHRQHFPRPGWVEHDPAELLANAHLVCGEALASAGARPADLAAVGLTNQRETTVVWERATGHPVYRAIVWQDIRTAEACERLGALGGGAERYRATTGLPLASYFAGPKIAWILDEVPGARGAAERGELLAGTVDTWLLWNLTGGPHGGLHATDPTNASRTLLMELRALSWDQAICAEVGVPPAMLPAIRSSSEVYGQVAAGSPLERVAIAGILGDQQSALFGQSCTEAGEAKNTYGTGSFLLLNTGATPVASRSGLLTTVAYRLGDAPARYALEGSIAVTGSLIQWLRDNLGIISSASEVEELAASVPDNGGVHIVPAFQGLLAPYWRPDARGLITGLTRYATKAHIARAALEGVALQVRDVVEAMNRDAPEPLRELRVDGGMVANGLLMQLQADLLGIPVQRTHHAETTALGAAYVAGLATGYWSSVEELRGLRVAGERWAPSMPPAERDAAYTAWQRAVQRAL